jgi:Spherulation-specific family 4
MTTTTNSTTNSTTIATGTTSTTTTQQSSIHPQTETTGIIIPLYTNYSTTKWSEVVQAKISSPNVPIVAIVNPHTGPGDYYNSTFAAGVKGMQDAGIVVLGYVWTDYGAKDTSSLKEQMQAYFTWYGVNGILLDGMANWLHSPSGTYMPAYYANLTAYAKSIGMTKVFGNPGADVPVQFIGTVDTMGIFENSFVPSVQMLGGWHTSYNKTNFAFFSYNVTSLSSLSSSYIAEASNYVGYLFLSNMTRPHYPTPPPYLDQLVATLGSMTTVTVQSVSQDGSLIPGALKASITYPDGSSITEITPFIFQVYAGSVVQITVEDYGRNIFEHWEDGSTLRTVTMKALTPTVLKAYVGPTP